MPTFEVPEALRLRVSVPAGEVHVETIDGRSAEVEVTPLRDDDASREAAEKTTVELKGRDLVVEAPKRGWSFGRDPKIRIAAKIPAGSDLAVRTASAPLLATGTYAAVEATTASGDVTVGTATSLRATTASGDVRADDVSGTATVKTASGEVRLGHVGTLEIAGVSGSVRVDTADDGAAIAIVSGDVELASVARGDVTVKSVSGDVRVGVPAGTRVHVDASSMSGTLRSDIPLDDAPGGSEGPLLDIRGKTVSGDVHVRRAATV